MNHLLRRRTFLQAGVLSGIALSLALAGCKTPDKTGNSAAPGAATAQAVPYPADAKAIVLGEYGSMTGALATFGQSTDNAIKMATDEINAKGGVLKKPVEIALEDDGSRAEQVPSAVLKLINEKNVLAVLGEVASSNSLAAAPICQSAGVPMLSPSSTNPKVTQVGDYIFRACFIDPFQGSVMAKFAGGDLKAKNAAIFTDVKSDYSKGLTEFFKKEFTANGGKIVAEESYRAGETDFRAQLTNIKAQKPDVIYIPGYYTEVANIAVQARSLGIDVPLLGGDGWDSPKLFEIGRKAVNNCYLTNHYSPENKAPKVVKFVTDYKKKYGETPDALAAVAYDAAYVMFDAIERAGGTDRAKLRDALAATKDFKGVTGTISMDKDRNAQKTIVVLKIQDGKQNFVKEIDTK